MKKICFLLLLFLIHSAQAQYNYFDNNPQWHVHNMCSNGTPSCICNIDVIYTVEGDTTIGAFTYKKIGKRSYEVCAWMGPPPVAPTCAGTSLATGKAGFLRQDGYKMYMYSPGGDQLLYDFDLETGDTLTTTFLNWDQYIVDSVDTLEVNGEFRKRFYLGSTSGGPATFLIDGIGSSRGFLEPMSVTFECGYELWCYELNNDEKAFTSNACNFDVGINHHASENPVVSVFPNPSTGDVKITYVHETLVSARIEIFNALGELVQTHTSINSSIDVSLKQNGVYTYLVSFSTGQKTTGKIVVTR